MFPYSAGVMTVVQGLYSLVWIVILMDVLSPTLDLRALPEWSGPQALLVAAGLASILLAVGTAMSALSRRLFQEKRHAWSLRVLTSPSVRARAGDLARQRPNGGPSLDEVRAAEGDEQVHKAREFMHAIDQALLIRAPHLHRSVQIYHDQYRLARGFILPSLMLAVVLPFWDVVPAGHLGAFPLISFQLFFLAVFFCGVSMYTFRERWFRYAAARVRMFLALELEEAADGRARERLSAIA